MSFRGINNCNISIEQSTSCFFFNVFQCNVADLSVDPGLVDVQEVQSSSSAFAAILANGKVVAWGDFEGGGEMTQGAEMIRDG